jgi:hypothetical protein
VLKKKIKKLIVLELPGLICMVVVCWTLPKLVFSLVGPSKSQKSGRRRRRIWRTKTRTRTRRRRGRRRRRRRRRRRIRIGIRITIRIGEG